MLSNQMPHQLKFTMPAEWEKHSATWTTWPFDEEMWAEKLKEVRLEFSTLVQTISQFEKVHLFLRDKEAEESAHNFIKLNKNIVLHHVPLNDIWFRDNGPIFIKQGNNIQFTKWEFNAWGQKFHWELDNEVPYYVAKYLNMTYFKTNIVMEGGSLDVNGEGIALTTKQCLLSKMRNPNLSQSDLEKHLKNYLGIEKLLWLEDGLEGDHTDGHIDTIVRFVNTNTIVCSLTDDIQDKNYSVMQKNFELLKSFKDLNGNSFEIIPLVLPKNRMELEGKRLPCTYANFYIGNGFVVVPQYDDPFDKIALNTLTPLFPDRKVIGLSSKYLILGGGSFHCVTQQQPE